MLKQKLLTLEQQPYKDKIKKAYELQGARVKDITYEGSTDSYPYFKVQFSIDGLDCSIMCPVAESSDTASESWYHITDIWNTDVTCDVHIEHKWWTGLDFDNTAYSKVPEATYKTLSDLILDIYNLKDHYERKREQLYSAFSAIEENEDLTLYNLPADDRFYDLQRLCRKILNLTEA